MHHHRPRIGLALGSGAARGWSHIGVIRALAEIGIEPHIVCGCSIGAVVGAAYAAGNLGRLEGWVRSLSMLELVRFFELSWSRSGFVDTDRLDETLVATVCGEHVRIEDLTRPFAAVATDLATGREMWLTEGPVLRAVWSSISLPGLFPPVRHLHRWLVDGGLVNPVPVSLCRALGADLVIAVNLNGDIVGKHFRPRPHAPADGHQSNGNGDVLGAVKETLKGYSAALLPGTRGRGNGAPGTLDAIAGSINIVQDRITRSRMAGDPPDVLLAPKLAHVGLLEFHRAGETIEEGRQAVRRLRPEIEHVLGNGR